jgi:hypothetical protein
VTGGTAEPGDDYAFFSAMLASVDFSPAFCGKMKIF